MCRQPLFIVYRAPRALQNMCDGLVVKCPNAIAGCREQRPRSMLEAHVKKCQLDFEPCPKAGCMGKIRPGLAHRGCQHYLVSCPACRTRVQMMDLPRHTQEDCRVPCTVCGEFLPWDQYVGHGLTCREMPAKCRWRPYGCTQTPKRKNLAAHEASCCHSQVSQRLRQLVAEIRSVNTRLDIQVNEFLSINAQLHKQAGEAERTDGEFEDFLRPVQDIEKALHETWDKVDTLAGQALSLLAKGIHGLPNNVPRTDGGSSSPTRATSDEARGGDV